VQLLEEEVLDHERTFLLKTKVVGGCDPLMIASQLNNISGIDIKGLVGERADNPVVQEVVLNGWKKLLNQKREKEI
jgi:hypothetical protein